MPENVSGYRIITIQVINSQTLNPEKRTLLAYHPPVNTIAGPLNTTPACREASVPGERMTLEKVSAPLEWWHGIPFLFLRFPCCQRRV